MKAVIVSLSFGVASVLAATASSISNCPALPARTSAAKDVTDLRIDDISMIGALGDSIMAGFGMMGVDYSRSGLLNFSTLLEYRGSSYGIGGDTGAVTLGNFVKRYNSNVKGASVLSHLASICSGATCSFPTSVYEPLKDNNNAAQSGAMAVNLDYELDYLINRMKAFDILTNNYNTDWKMITIQIGSNDQCAACGSNAALVTAEAYGNYVEAAIKRIQAEIPKTVVNLLGTFKVSGVFPLSANNSYCKPNNLLYNLNECSCSGSQANWTIMDNLSDAYNAKLQSIANKYKGTAGGTFAVMYSPAPIQLSSFPIDALSNIDCFHPSLKGHQWIAKNFWNQLFLSSSQKPSVMTFDANLQVYCPTSTDRLPTS